MQYFVVMIDYGRRGFEAIIHPEDTRRQIIEQVREVLASDTLSLVHVKCVDGNFIFDCTSEICEAAGDVNAPLSPLSDRHAAAFDRARDYHKETV